MGFRRGIIVLVLVVVLCGSVGANPYWLRMSQGFPNEVFIYEQYYQKSEPWVEIKAVIPQIGGAPDESGRRELNERIKKEIEDFVEDTLKWAWQAKEADPHLPTFPQVGQVDYELKLNRGGLLSLTLTFYHYGGGAHGMTYLTGLNLDLITGRTLKLEDLLGDPGEWERLLQIINARIQKEPTWFFIQEFTREMLRDIAGFYLQEEGIVVYFGLYEIAPYAAGLQKFLLPLD